MSMYNVLAMTDEEVDVMQKIYDNCDCKRDFAVAQRGTFEDLEYLIERYEYFRNFMNCYCDNYYGIAYELSLTEEGRRKHRIIEANYTYYLEKLADLTCTLVDNGKLPNYVPTTQDNSMDDNT